MRTIVALGLMVAMGGTATAGVTVLGMPDARPTSVTCNYGETVPMLDPVSDEVVTYYCQDVERMQMRGLLLASRSEVSAAESRAFDANMKEWAAEREADERTAMIYKVIVGLLMVGGIVMLAHYLSKPSTKPGP